MTVTDDERREVARELRVLPIDMPEVAKSWAFEGIDTCCPDQTDYYLIHQAVFGCVPADHMHPCDYEELHMRLADLIEPEHERTCRIDMPVIDWETGETDYRCSSCGFSSDPQYWAETYVYCPNCGAKVVKE